MMTVTPTRRGVRFWLSGIAVAVVLAVGFGFYALPEPGAEVIEGSSDAPGWKTIEYEGVRVDIPASWERLEMGDCEFRVERWGPPAVPPCEPDAEGVAFYGSATYDAELGPGVIRSDAENSETPDWEGYVRAGEFAVHASAGDRADVEAILDSAKSAAPAGRSTP